MFSSFALSVLIKFLNSASYGTKLFKQHFVPRIQISNKSWTFYSWYLLSFYLTLLLLSVDRYKGADTVIRELRRLSSRWRHKFFFPGFPQLYNVWDPLVETLRVDREMRQKSLETVEMLCWVAGVMENFISLALLPI